MREDYIILDKPFGFNMRSSDYKKMTKIVMKEYEKYQGSITLFARCAILKLIREEEAHK